MKAENEPGADVLRAALERLSKLGLPLTVDGALNMGSWAKGRYSGLEECRGIALDALSAAPSSPPRQDAVREAMEKAHDALEVVAIEADILATADKGSYTLPIESVVKIGRGLLDVTRKALAAARRLGGGA